MPYEILLRSVEWLSAVRRYTPFDGTSNAAPYLAECSLILYR